MKSKNWSLQKNFDFIDYETKTQYSLKEFFRQINLNKTKFKKIEALLYGSFQSNIYGTGFDFNEIREYKIGDDLRHISWTATAKTGTLHTKEYFSEKEIRSYFLIDISNSMFCGNKLEPFIQLIAFLLTISTNFSEKIGGVFFSSDIKYHFPLSQASPQANVMFQTFYNFFNNLNTQGKKLNVDHESTNILKALDFTKQYFHKKGLVFIISDFINIGAFEKSIFDSAQKQNIYCFQIYDPIDFFIPKAGYISIIDPETNKRSFVNTDSKTIQDAYNNLMKEKQEKLKVFLKTIGVHHMIIEKGDFY